MRLVTTLLLTSCALVAQDGQRHEVPDLSHLPPGLYAAIDTYMGMIVAELYDKQVPNATLNFIGLSNGRRAWKDPKTRKMVNRPLYENLIFHRVIPQFMIQTGDPTGVGDHDCGYFIPDEIKPDLIFDKPGRLALASLEKPNTGSCQFFITDAPAPQLNGKFTIFGQVVEGMEAVTRLARVVTDSKDKPRIPMALYSVTVIRKTTPAK